MSEREYNELRQAIDELEARERYDEARRKLKALRLAQYAQRVARAERQGRMIGAA